MTDVAGPAVERRAALRRRVVAAAWELAERDGLTRWTLRDLAAAVGMRAPSLYTHFAGKDDIHDALFEDGHVALDDALGTALAEVDDDDTWGALVVGTTAFVDFCAASVPRYQLLFTHALGDWAPSPQAYAASLRSFDAMRDRLRAAGVTDPRHVDIFTALGSGLVAQQLANDLGGTRWRQLVPDTITMFLAHVEDDRSTA